ncbi:hypothetical protein N9L68_03890 [bacterium]|nr:hypothetical protein [bacterium]
MTDGLPYITLKKESTKSFEQDRKQVRRAGSELADLQPPHERARGSP